MFQSDRLREQIRCYSWCTVGGGRHSEAGYDPRITQREEEERSGVMSALKQ